MKTISKRDAADKTIGEVARELNLVNKKTCKEIADQLNLKKFIKTGNSFKSIKSSDEKILSDCCEALIGAIYLDQGLAVSEKFILRNWKNFIKKSNITQIDPKTKLQEYSLKNFKNVEICTPKVQKPEK